MAVYFFDTSAVVKRYVAEVGTAWVRAIVDPVAGNSIYLCRITAVELTAAVTRRQRGGTISAADAATMLAEFRRDMTLEFRVIELTPALLDRAALLAETHGLRAYDAVQLAVAEELSTQRAVGGLSSLILVSADQELNAAAGAVGMSVEDPGSHP
jgi:predicted nucleic acid-binding protein